MGGAPLTGYDVIVLNRGEGDEEAFQGRWCQTLESAIPQVAEAETKHSVKGYRTSKRIDAATWGMARNFRHVRVRGVLCRE
jgi:hypothetical protein